MTFADHTLSARFVPYGEVADVFDRLPDGNVDRYREAFVPAAFARQAATRERGVLARIHMRHLHDRNEGIGFIGPVTALRDEPDGLYGDVHVISSRADDVDGLLRNGVDGVSIEFHSPKGGTTERDGVRWRSRAVLWAVSLEPQGAYSTARVLSYRDDGPDDDDEVDDDDATLPPDPPITPVEAPDGPDAVVAAERAAALDPDYWAKAAERQAELDRQHRPVPKSEEELRLEALHDAAVASYHSR